MLKVPEIVAHKWLFGKIVGVSSLDSLSYTPKKSNELIPKNGHILKEYPAVSFWGCSAYELVVCVPGIRFWKGFVYLGVPLESQTTGPQTTNLSLVSCQKLLALIFSSENSFHSSKLMWKLLFCRDLLGGSGLETNTTRIPGSSKGC